MENLNEITYRMTLQEFEAWEARRQVELRDLAQKAHDAIERHKRYREQMIGDILRWAPGRFAADWLRQRSTSTLERIYDHC